jgi:O-antigen ligase
MNSRRYDSIYFGAWLICVVTLPWLIQWNSIAIIILAAVSLAGGNYKEQWKRLKSSMWIWPFILFFFLHLVGLLFTEDSDSGFFELEKKLSFLVLPVIAGAGIAPSKSMLRILLNAFVCSCLVVVLLSIYFTWSNLIDAGPAILHNFDLQTAQNFHELNPGSSPSWEYFSYIQLGDSMDVHPAYFSMYLVFSCVILLNDMLERERISVPRVIVIALFICFVILLSSRIAIVSLVMVFAYLFYHYFKRSPAKVAVGMLSFVLTITVMIFLNPVSRFRVLQEPLFTSLEISPSNTEWNSVNLRMLEWKASLHAIGESWLTGLGTGDAQHALNDYYGRFSERTAQVTYNAHNQYFQTTLELGWAGCAALLLCFFKPLGSSKMDPVFMAFIILFSVMCLTESMLARQKGIVFFTLFESLLLGFHFQE